MCIINYNITITSSNRLKSYSFVLTMPIQLLGIDLTNKFQGQRNKTLKNGITKRIYFPFSLDWSSILSDPLPNNDKAILNKNFYQQTLVKFWELHYNN